jgi:pimeloyl-ACP methyl ester carboxylesterase
VLQEAVERFSFYCRTEVVGFNPHGIGDSEGTLSLPTLIADVENVVHYLAPRPLVLIGFGLVGYAMLACANVERVVGVVTVDPLVDQLTTAEIIALGVRAGSEASFPSTGVSIPTDPGLGRWMLIAPGDKMRDDSLGIDRLIQSRQPEVHRLYATSARLHNDPRPYALILGWLERELWTDPSISRPLDSGDDALSNSSAFS